MMIQWAAQDYDSLNWFIILDKRLSTPEIKLCNWRSFY